MATTSSSNGHLVVEILEKIALKDKSERIQIYYSPERLANILQYESKNFGFETMLSISDLYNVNIYLTHVIMEISHMIERVQRAEYMLEKEPKEFYDYLVRNNPFKKKALSFLSEEAIREKIKEYYSDKKPMDFSFDDYKLFKIKKITGTEDE